jgi:hypothetical protein
LSSSFFYLFFFFLLALFSFVLSAEVCAKGWVGRGRHGPGAASISAELIASYSSTSSFFPFVGSPNGFITRRSFLSLVGTSSGALVRHRHLTDRPFLTLRQLRVTLSPGGRRGRDH